MLAQFKPNPEPFVRRLKVSDSLPFIGFLRDLANRPSKIAKPAVFQAVLQGIRKSFQSAITAPRMNLTGYGNATAQSWLHEDA